MVNVTLKKNIFVYNRSFIQGGDIVFNDKDMEVTIEDGEFI